MAIAFHGDCLSRRPVEVRPLVERVWVMVRRLE